MSDSKREQLDHPRALARRDLLRGVAMIGAATAIMAEPSLAQTAGVEEEGEYQCRAFPRPPQGTLNVDLNAFLQVSRVLTGMPLDSANDMRIGTEYLDRCAHVAELADKNALPDLITAYQQMTNSQQDPQAIASALVKNDATKAAAEQLIYLWYLSAFYVVPQQDPKRPPPPGSPQSPAWVYGTPAQYESALLWKVVNAHPPMLRGGPPGYWARRPNP